MKIFGFKKNKIKLNYIDSILNLEKIKKLRNCPYEEIYAIFLRKSEDNKKDFYPIYEYRYGFGNEYSISIDSYKPNEIPEISKMFDADAIVIVHNHPTINGKISRAYPSKGDIESTIDVAKDWQSKGCLLLDHIIINERKHYSFVENDLINILE